MGLDNISQWDGCDSQCDTEMQSLVGSLQNSDSRHIYKCIYIVDLTERKMIRQQTFLLFCNQEKSCHTYLTVERLSGSTLEWWKL